jgi:protein TonB
MIGRVAFALVTAALVTGIVLFTMQALIATAPRDLDESDRRHFVDFVRVEREETLQRKDRKATKPAQPEAPPTLGAQPRTDAIEPTDVPIELPQVEVGAELEIGGLGLDTVSGDYLPIVKAAPIYPWKARSALVQGHCIVEYTVTEAGTVKDVVVIEADPPGYFEQASIEAALKFKYKPRVVAGEPIEVRGVRNLFRYQLEE